VSGQRLDIMARPRAETRGVRGRGRRRMVVGRMVGWGWGCG
jgi:hypothetical protein